MDKQEARQLLAKELSGWRSHSYDQLVSCLDQIVTKEVGGESGAAYQIEIQVFWDAQPGGNLRVVGGIDDGGWSAFKPLNDDFIMTPDGSFVGE